VYLTQAPLLNKTPSDGIEKSLVVFAVPSVLYLNKVVPLSGDPLINSTSPAVPPDTTDIPLSLTLLELSIA
jgi:hypothetical protein